MYLLSHIEGELEISSSVFRVEFGEVKGLGMEVMYKGTECHPVIPTTREISDVHILKENREQPLQ